MSIEYIWKITQMERVLSTGMVTKVGYTLDAFDGIYTAGATGSLDLTPCEPDDMIPFGKLDEKTVCTWVIAALGEEKINEVKELLCGRIKEQHEPTYGFGLPW